MDEANTATAGPLKPEPEKLREELANFAGDLDRYRHWTRHLIYTPGVKCLADQAGAYWLIDLIAAWRMQPKIARTNFQIWDLVVRPDRTGTATATGDNKISLTSQEIEFTDFPLAEITLWLIDGTLILPSEY